MHSSRREFLAGAVATGAGLALPLAGEVSTAEGAASTAPTAKQRLVRRGRAIAASPRGERLIVAHAQRRTVAIFDRRRGTRRLVDLKGQPLELAVSPDGRLAAATTASWDRPGLTLLDLKTARVLRTLDVGAAPFAVAFTPTGKRVVISGGEQDGTMLLIDLERRRVVSRTAIGRVPRGVAVSAGAAWIALAGEGSVVRLDLDSGRVTRRVAVRSYPDRIALSPDGRRLLIAHGGRRTDHVSELDLASGRARNLGIERQASAVAWTRAGDRLIALGTANEILAIDANGRRRHLRVGPGPRGLATAGRRAFTVSSITGAVNEVRA